MHWADVVAKKLSEMTDVHVLATAITPSGPIHVGNLREVLTAEAIYRSLCRYSSAELIYIADTFDPLRRVYPFLPESYEQYVGMPLSDIPCPCGSHDNYAEHFLEPFFTSIEELGIRPKRKYAHEMYRNGTYNEAIKTALDNAAVIRDIMRAISQRKLSNSWMPFNVRCESCGRLNGIVLTYEYPTVTYVCESCHTEGTVDIKTGGVGKLPWRVDWPARWKIFDVTFEAFGKDHAAAGGSWDTGKEIIEKVYHSMPPMPFVYEFIQLKGKGAMHSSTGTAISAEEILKMTPPEVIRFLFMKYEPSRHIDFDQNLGLLDLVDEYDKYERIFFGFQEETAGAKDSHRVYELSQPNPDFIPDEMPVQVHYRHLVTLIQIAKTAEGVFQILERNGEITKLNLSEEKKLHDRINRVKYWLSMVAPDVVKFSLQEHPPLLSLTKYEKTLLATLYQTLKHTQWNPEAIHSAIYTIASQQPDQKQQEAATLFGLVYRMFLSKDRGPRVGYFLHSLGKDYVLERINSYL